MTAPLTDAAGRTAVICGACRGSGLVPEGSIAVAGDIARPGDRCKECEGSGIARWEWPREAEAPVCPWCGRTLAACQCDEAGPF